LTQVSDDLIRYGRFSFDDCPFADPIYWAAFIISGA
jgi:CHAT domain-containing protein